MRSIVTGIVTGAVPVAGDTADRSTLEWTTMNHTLFTGPDGFHPRVRSGTLEYPVHHMRGGTSTGLILWEGFMPHELALREELLRHLMGVPLTGDKAGNRQISGLGRGPATSNKVFLADTERTADGIRLVSTLAQLASDHSGIDWSVNCGNMSAALMPWALDAGLISWEGAGGADLDIRNTNTGVITTARMSRGTDGTFVAAEIPGVDGAFPAVDLLLHDPVGAKTGRLLPTGMAADEVAGYRVSCVDVAVPMVIVDAASLGKTAHEPIAELASDIVFMDALRMIRVAAGLRMQLGRKDGRLMTQSELARSETVPKICIVGPPQTGGTIAVRYFTPQTGHASMAVSGGCCLAAATLIPGTVAAGIAQDLPFIGAEFEDYPIAIENPAGILDATIVARQQRDGLEIRGAAYRRSSQILLRGHMPLYRASDALVGALRRMTVQ